MSPGKNKLFKKFDKYFSIQIFYFNFNMSETLKAQGGNGLGYEVTKKK